MKFLALAVLAVLAFASVAQASDVVVLGGDNFDNQVGKDDKAWFVEFFAPWCGHCKKLAPTWEELATAVKGQVNVASVDCTVHRDLCTSKHGVRGFPTLIYFPKGTNTNGDRYQSARALSDFKSFLQSKGAYDASKTGAASASAPSASKAATPRVEKLKTPPPPAVTPGKITLRYFQTRGRAEVIRLVLEEIGVPYESQLYTREEWPEAKRQGKAKGMFLFGQLPSLSINEQHLVQSNAILRHLGKLFNLYPISINEEVTLEMYLGAVEDLRLRYSRLVYDPEFEAKKAEYIQKVIPEWFGYFSAKIGASQKNGHDFFMGSQVTILDFAVFDVVAAHVALDPEALAPFMPLHLHFRHMAVRPKILPYILSDRRPAHQNGVNAFFDTATNPGTDPFLRLKNVAAERAQKAATEAAAQGQAKQEL